MPIVGCGFNKSSQGISSGGEPIRRERLGSDAVHAPLVVEGDVMVIIGFAAGIESGPG